MSDKPRPRNKNPPPPGPHPGAGRPKGSHNKRHTMLIEQLEVDGKKAPAQVLLDIMHKAMEDGNAMLALQAAQAAAPYLHARLQSSDVNVDMEARVKSVVSDTPLTDAEWLAQFGAQSGDDEDVQH